MVFGNSWCSPSKDANKPVAGGNKLEEGGGFLVEVPVSGNIKPVSDGGPEVAVVDDEDNMTDDETFRIYKPKMVAKTADDGEETGKGGQGQIYLGSYDPGQILERVGYIHVHLCGNAVLATAIYQPDFAMKSCVRYCNEIINKIFLLSHTVR